MHGSDCNLLDVSREVRQERVLSFDFSFQHKIWITEIYNRIYVEQQNVKLGKEMYL